MIKLMLELIKLFGEKKIEKLVKFDGSMQLQAEFGGEKYSIDVTRLTEAAQDVQMQ